MNKELTEYVKAVEEAKAKLGVAVLEEISRLGHVHDLDCMEFLLTSEFTRNGEEVEIQEIDEVEKVYLDHVSDGGFMGIWVPDTGWIPEEKEDA